SLFHHYISFFFSFFFFYFLFLFSFLFFFFFNDTATTEIYTLSLHDALLISLSATRKVQGPGRHEGRLRLTHLPDRKSTRLNSSHATPSYAVFCLKKKKT